MNRQKKDFTAKILSFFVTFLVSLIIVVVAIVLIQKSTLILASESLQKLLSPKWNPDIAEFGYLPFITGTVYTTGLAMIIAIPICLLTSARASICFTVLSSFSVKQLPPEPTRHRQQEN